MKRGTHVQLKGGTSFGVILLSPSEVDGISMCLVGWPSWDNIPRYTWERIEDLVLC